MLLVNMMKTLLVFVLAICSSFGADFRPAAPDDGGVRPYLEEIGRNLPTYKALLSNAAVSSMSGHEATTFRDSLLPNLEDLLPDGASAECLACVSGLPFLRTLINKLGRTFDAMRDSLVSVCENVMNRQGRPGSEICPGIIDNYGPLVFQIVGDTRHQKPAKEACRFLNICPPAEFDSGESSPIGETNDQSPYQDVRENSDFFGSFGVESSERTRREVKDEKPGEVFKVLQITDVHFDPEYKEGSVKDCGFHVCCRLGYNGTGSASAWGEYTCNAPPATLTRVIQRAVELQPDLVLQTGDSPPHHLWYETLDQMMTATTSLAAQLHKAFPTTPILPSLGNHDAFPSNMYYPPNEDTQTLHERLLGAYSKDLNEAEIKRTVRVAGYYEKVISSGPSPLRVLCYNSNYGYTDNYFNLLSHYEEAEYLQMRFFVEERLATARRDNAKVILIAHHPAGDGILPFDQWVSDVCTKYSDVIVLHVAGHKHTDMFTLFRADKDPWASGVQFAAPSANPYNTINPSMRLYTLDKRTHRLLDIHQYRMDLVEANRMTADQEPPMELVYQASEEYHLPDMSAASWHGLAMAMTENTTLLNSYRHHWSTNVPEDLRNVTCLAGDEGCMRPVVCGIVTSNVLDRMRCNRAGVQRPVGPKPTTTTRAPDSGTDMSVRPSIVLPVISVILAIIVQR